jgi:Ca2+-binding EF-hand superfamily protein
MKTIPVSLVFAGSLLGASALPAPERPEQGPPAQKERPQGPEGERRGPKHQPIEFWKQADTNGDGLISKDEFLALERIKNLPEEKRDKFFNRLDKNSDGSVSIEELRKMAPGENEGGPQGLPRLPELDTDRSGGVSFVEFKAAPFVQKLPAERQETLFKRLDRDGDGQITPKDRPEGPPKGRPEGPGGEMEPRQMIHRLDANGDGSVSFEEFQKAPFAEKMGEDALEDRFEKLDKNGDKKLSPEDMPPPSEGGRPPEKPERPAPPKAP